MPNLEDGRRISLKGQDAASFESGILSPRTNFEQEGTIDHLSFGVLRMWLPWDDSGGFPSMVAYDKEA